MKNVSPKKKRLRAANNKALPAPEVPSTHVNADGSITEMEDVLKKEEEKEETENVKSKKEESETEP